MWSFKNKKVKPKEEELFSRSYAQCGEDLIVAYILKCLHIDKPTYLDIGANHPTHFSNTFLLYEKGGSGTAIEANPKLCELFRTARPLDKVLNLGVATVTDTKTLPFYLTQPDTLSSFNKIWLSKSKIQIKETILIEVVHINSILEQMPHINFLNCDVEGLDYDILTSMDFSRFKPDIICVETIVYSNYRNAEKDSRIEDHLAANGYIVYGSTFINTIFVNFKEWQKIA